MRRHPAIYEIFLFEAYLSNMENFIEAEKLKTQERIEEIFTDSVSTPEEDFDRGLEQHFFGYTDSEWEMKNQQLEWDYKEQEGFLEGYAEFSNILRKSFFATFYGFLEARLISECRKLALEYDIDPSLLPPKRRGSIDRAKQFFEEVLDIVIEDGTDWEKFQNFKLLRHCIVHNEGRLDEGFEDKDQSLRLYVQDNEFLHLRSNTQIVFERGFCEEAIQTVQRYLTALFITSQGYSKS